MSTYQEYDFQQFDSETGNYFSRHNYYKNFNDSIRKSQRIIYYRIIFSDPSLWPEEEKELDDIKSGKAKMITQKGEEFMDELNKMINE